jgi:flagellin FlaB
VLINTAGFLQSQAEATGEESTSQVSDGILVSAASVSVNDGAPDASPELTFQLKSGSDPVDLQNVRYEATGDVTAGPVAVSDTAKVLDGGFKTVTLDELSGLSTGAEIEIVFTTPNGGQTTEILRVPDTISDDTSKIQL